jgi:predicted small metal-binding protein
MTLTLKCSEFGNACPAVFRGPTVEAVLEQAKKHGMEAHGQTAEQVNAPETARIAAEKTRGDYGPDLS